MSAHTWVKDREARGEIVIAKTANESERFAAEELSSYFEKISGTRLPVVEGLSHKSRPVIILLDASRPSNRKFLKAVDLSALQNDGFFIQSDGNDLLIGSLEPSGLVFGTYQYLARAFDVRFFDYGPEGEDIPYLDTLEHEPFNLLRNPRLKVRSLQHSQSDYNLQRIEWMAKNGFNLTRIVCPSLKWWDENAAVIAPEFKKRGIRILFGPHIFQQLIAEETYLANHPEYFPVKKDGRRGSQGQFSWSLKNPEALEEVVRVVIDFLRRHPEIDMFGFFPGDGFYEVDEEDYKAVTGQPAMQHGEWEKHCHGCSPTARLGNPNKARIYAIMAKRVAEAVAAHFPKLPVATIHYIDLIQPCPDVRLPDNVVPIPTMYWRCIKHSLVDDHCVYNRQFKQALQEWTTMYPDRVIFLYEYYMGMSIHASLPYPMLTTLFREWPELHAMGIDGAHIQSNSEHAVPYNINYLAFAALAWDLAPDVQSFLRDYCEGFFNEAAVELEQMYRLWEEGAQQAQDDTQPGGAFFSIMFSVERAQRCRDLLNTAIQKATDPKIIYRIARLMALMEYAGRVAGLAPAFLEAAHRQRRGEDIEDLKAKYLPQVRDRILPYIRRLKELGQSIYEGRGRIQKMEPLRKRDVTARATGDGWERMVALWQKKAWAEEAFDPDLAEAELARKKNLNAARKRESG